MLPEQLQKMGILPTAAKAQSKTMAINDKRRSMQDHFSKCKPLHSNGLKNFSTMRDPHDTNGEKIEDKVGKKRQPDSDSDDDVDPADDVLIKAEEAESKDVNAKLSPEDAKKQGELAEGVQKIRVCLTNSIFK